MCAYIGVVLIPLNSLKHFRKFQISGILHIGAHKGEENPTYKKFTSKRITWIEAQTDLISHLEKIVAPNDEVIKAVVGEHDGQFVNLKVTNNSQSSSILDLGTHEKDYPEVKVIRMEEVRISRIDVLFLEKELPNFVNIDIQGAELQALKSFGSRLNEVDVIYLEVNNKEVYDGCAQVTEVDSYLAGYEFKRATTYWIIKKGWGDAIYVNERIAKNFLIYRLKLLPGKIVGYLNQYTGLMKSKIQASCPTAKI